jgi:hypothetical protein
MVPEFVSLLTAASDPDRGLGSGLAKLTRAGISDAVVTASRPARA